MSISRSNSVWLQRFSSNKAALMEDSRLLKYPLSPFWRELLERSGEIKIFERDLSGTQEFVLDSKGLNHASIHVLRLKEGCVLELFEKDLGTKHHGVQVILIQMEKDSRLNWTRVFEGSNPQNNYRFVHMELGEDSQCHLKQAFFHEGLSFDEVQIHLKGDRSEISNHVLFLGKGQSEAEFRMQHRHFGHDTKSYLLAQGAALDHSRHTFYGELKMDPGSNRAQGELYEKSLILSPNARIHATPALEIAHHEVQASHSVSMTQVSPEEFFYLCSRGLEENLAKELIVTGFFKGSLREFKNQELEEELLNILKKALIWT